MTKLRPVVSVSGTAVVRRRPSLLMMLRSVEATAPTLELALSRLRLKSEAAVQLLQRLDAQNIEFGEPRFPEQQESGPLSMARRRVAAVKAAAGARGAKNKTNGPGNSHKQVQATVSAVWPIEDMTSEEVLILVDRLQFETADQSEEADQPELPESDGWESGLAQQAREMFSGLVDVPEQGGSQFLFVSRLPEDLRKEAVANAVADGRKKAELIAEAAGRQIGDIETIYTNGIVPHEMQIKRYSQSTNMPLLAETSFGSVKDEIILESPRAADFNISLTLSFHLK